MPADANDIQAEMDKRINEIRKEMDRLNKSLAGKASDALEGAGDAYDTARSRASDYARQFGAQAQQVADAARENPGTAAATIGLAAFVAGLAVGCILSGGRR